MLKDKSGRVLLTLLLGVQQVDATFKFGMVGSVESTKILVCFISLFALIILFEFVTGLIDYTYVEMKQYFLFVEYTATTSALTSPSLPICIFVSFRLLVPLSSLFQRVWKTMEPHKLS
jgi:hypothetical protein